MACTRTPTHNNPSSSADALAGVQPALEHAVGPRARVAALAGALHRMRMRQLPALRHEGTPAGRMLLQKASARRFGGSGALRGRAWRRQRDYTENGGKAQARAVTLRKSGHGTPV